MRGFLATWTVLCACVSFACAEANGRPNTGASVTPGATASAQALPAVAFDAGELRFDAAGDERAISVEFAVTPEQFGRGLGYRDALPADAGMLFVMDDARIPTFWMKGMRFPLDFVWIGADRRVVSVTPEVPHQPGASDAELVRYSPGVPVRYILELNAGAAAQLGFEPGVEVAFELP